MSKVTKSRSGGHVTDELEAARGPWQAGDSKVQGLDKEVEKLAKSANLWADMDIEVAGEPESGRKDISKGTLEEEEKSYGHRE